LCEADETVTHVVSSGQDKRRRKAMADFSRRENSLHRLPGSHYGPPWLLLTGVAVEKLISPKFAKMKLRQDDL
jgi:hypothetical protein